MALEHGRTLKLAADAGQGDVVFRQLGQVQVIAKKNRNRTVSGGSAGDDIQQGSFAGTVRANQTAQLAGVEIERERIQALKPSKLTVTFST